MPTFVFIIIIGGLIGLIMDICDVKIRMLYWMLGFLTGVFSVHHPWI